VAIVDSLLAVAIIGVLILLNAIFVAAEFAIVGAPRVAIERRSRLGERVAQLVLAVLEDPRRQDRYIATAQLGITFASLGLGMYGEHVLAGWIFSAVAHWGGPAWLASHVVASTASIAALTYLHIVLGEMVPKALALQRPEQTSVWITPPMLAVQSLLYPLVAALNGMGNLVLAMAGIRRQAAGHERYYSAEELQLVVEESRRAGVLADESGRLIQEIFEFADRTVGEAMTPRVRVVGVRLSASPEELRSILETAPHARYPVYEHDLDHIVGFVHVKQLLQLLVAGDTLTTDHVRPIPMVPETAGLDAVLAIMRRERAHMVLVIDEYGGVAGVITLEDLVEEVVGEVDGMADQAPAIHRTNGTLRVSGLGRMHELGAYLGMDLDHEDVDSVSGLVLALLGRPPRVGDTVEYGPLSITVTAVRGLGLGECTVRPREGEGGGPGVG
jgi:CBS domain containing-hemolysin-like protein